MATYKVITTSGETFTVEAANESAAAMATARAKRYAQEIELVGGTPSATQTPMQMAALWVAILGLFIAPLAIVGIVMGVQLKNRAAIVVGAIASVVWVLALPLLVGA